MKTLAAYAAQVVLFLFASSALAAETATITDMHLCCKGCTSAVEKSVADISGATCKADQKQRTAVVTAANPKDLQKALDAIAAAGFCGKVDNSAVTFKPIEFKEGEKVHRLEVAHVHNCCMACTNAIKKAVEAVDGVKGNTVKNKEVSFVVEGDFAPADVVKALEGAGFYPTLKGEETKK